MCPPLEPHWTAYVQAIGTPFVASIAGLVTGWIAYRQWRTAKEKVLLDLFEKRLGVYNLINDAVGEIIARGRGGADMQVLGRIARASIQSKFLFGPEIVQAFMRVWWLTNKLQRNARNQSGNNSKSDLIVLRAEEDDLVEELNKFTNRIDDMVAPYMLMDAKITRIRLGSLVSRVIMKSNELADWVVIILFKQGR